MNSTDIDLQQLPQLGDLFRLFNSGKHLNRVAEPLLWTELEQQQEHYQTLFSALGYQLRVDGRGFAWFHNEEASSNTSKATRQLALLFMVLFDLQADAGKPLQRFSDWVINPALLTEVLEQHRELLQAEGLDLDGLRSLMETAARYGFATSEGGGWRLLPAVFRYLDHIEELAHQYEQDDNETWRETAAPQQQESM